MECPIGPIDIQMEDHKRYGLVALLVDRDDFLIDIEKARKLLQIQTIPYVLPKYSFKETNYITKAYREGIITINGVRKALEEIRIQKNQSNLIFIDKVLGSAIILSESLLKKYNKGRSYFSVIFACILIGKVTDFDFPSTYMIEFNNIKDASLELENFEIKDGVIAIVVNKESTSKDVSQVFDFIRKYRFKSKEIENNDGLKDIYEDKVSEIKLMDTLSAIKETRKWYWWNKNENIGAKKILDQLGDNAFISQKGIEQALTRYKKLLQEPF